MGIRERKMKMFHNSLVFSITTFISSYGQFPPNNEICIAYEYKIEINDVKGPEWSEGLPQKATSRPASSGKSSN